MARSPRSPLKLRTEVLLVLKTKGSLLWPITFDWDPSQDILALNQCSERKSVWGCECECDERGERKWRERKIKEGSLPYIRGSRPSWTCCSRERKRRREKIHVRGLWADEAILAVGFSVPENLYRWLGVMWQQACATILHRSLSGVRSIERKKY